MKGKNCFYSHFFQMRNGAEGNVDGGEGWGWRGESQNVDFVVCWVCAFNHRGTHAPVGLEFIRTSSHPQPQLKPQEPLVISSREGILGTHTCLFYYFEHIKMETHLLPRSPRPRSLTNHFAVICFYDGPFIFYFLHLFICLGQRRQRTTFRN